MKYIDLHIKSFGDVFKNLGYIFFAIISAFLFYLLNLFILEGANIYSVFQSLGISETIIFIFNIVTSIPANITSYSLIFLIAISFLTGILISMLLYKSMNATIVKPVGILGSIGIALGIIAPGCASCGIGVAAIFGLTSSLLFLPFKGLEISLLAVVILSYSILKVSSSLQASCNIPIRKNERREKK